MRVRPATERDFWRFYGGSPPVRWWGVAGETAGGALVALGLVIWDDHGRAWASFERRGRVSATVMHRTATRALEGLREAGEPVLYTICDERIAGAAKWLERLGFAVDDGMSRDRAVWAWRK